MTEQTPRTIDLSVEVIGTPEEVWAAIATGAGASAWLHHTEVEAREGGRYAFDMGIGGGLDDSGTVTAWEPPRRFATGGVRWEPGQDGPPAELATEWTVEARDGGTCVVRMVMSGFGSGAAWDNEIDGMSSGMRAALDSLRAYLAARAAMAPARVLAAVAVKDRDAALPFYERLFGRPADALPMPVDAEWHASGTTLQVVQDPARAGGSLLTLAVDDLRGYVAALAGRGVPVGEIDDRTSDTVLFVRLDDPEGNRITLVQAL
jgi:uncharacterized protein YndB with AHSA1/START domain/predicted enzyme related to lactoylglutathione lyase